MACCLSIPLPLLTLARAAAVDVPHAAGESQGLGVAEQGHGAADWKRLSAVGGGGGRPEQSASVSEARARARRAPSRSSSGATQVRALPDAMPAGSVNTRVMPRCAAEVLCVMCMSPRD
eukprot:1421819-Rhodomonas_salina.2